MSKLTVTAKGQIDSRGELLRRLGVESGQRIEAHELPNGRVEISVIPRTQSIEAFFGILDGRTDRTATLEEIEEAIKAGWAGSGEGHHRHQCTGPPEITRGYGLPCR